MAKYALLRFSPFEYRYQQTYGIMPDYDFDRLIKQGYSAEDAARIRQERINKLWQTMKYEHEHENDFQPLQVGDGCPF